MPRDSKLYLNDIKTGIQNIERFILGLDETTFTEDEMRLHSVLFNLMIIGEAIKNLPDDMQASVPAVPWRDIKRFRDKLVHHYFSIEPAIVWQIIREDLPILKTAIEKLLQETKYNDDGEQ